MMNSDLQQQLLEQSQGFEALLREELQALQNAAPAAQLQQLAEQKMDASQSLEGLERYLRAQQPAIVMTEACRQCLQRCRDLNERIGTMLSRQADYNQQAMAILGLSQPSLPTYSTEGLPSTPASGRHLGEA
ncbi:hypothetical protein [Spongiibacter sp.]|uniref:hypothetical protein n=1 Tax=Spongiibacter sp. TaxID=2024860 RepID=UPI003565A985